MNAPETLAQDRIARWPLAIATGVPIAAILLDACLFSITFIFIWLPLLAVILIGGAIFATVNGILSLKARAWRNAISCFVLPTVVLVHASAPLAFVRFYVDMGDRLHFRTMYPFYEQAVKALPASGQPKLAVFDLGGGLFFTKAIVYDQSDQVVLDDKKRTLDWVARAKDTELSCGGIYAMPLGGHFYLTDIPC